MRLFEEIHFISTTLDELKELRRCSELREALNNLASHGSSYYFIANGSAELWRSEDEDIIDLKKAAQALHHFLKRSNNCALFKFNGMRNKPADPQPNIIKIINIVLKKNGTLNEIFALLDETREKKKASLINKLLKTYNIKLS